MTGCAEAMERKDRLGSGEVELTMTGCAAIGDFWAEIETSADTRPRGGVS